MRDDEFDLKPYQGMSSNQLYNYAKEALNGHNYEDAIKRYEALETIYPFNPYSTKAGLELIYAYYQKGDYVSSAATADRYIHLYPRERYVDYAYYMRGAANFEQPRGVFVNYFNYDPAWRDPGTQTQAYSDFQQLIKHFPNSPYSNDAKARLVYLRNMYAKKELHIANFYLQRKLYVAAYNRAQYLVKHYSQAPQAKQALKIMQTAANQLKLQQAGQDAKAVYDYTFSQKA